MSENITYPISVNYVKNWTVMEGLREYIQNWLDADGMGDDGFITRAEGTLTLGNPGVLKQKSLLLGESEKPDGAIGKFGEGYKLGAMVLLREGKTVQIFSNGKVFDPYLYNFHGESCLGFEIREASRYWQEPERKNMIVAQITGLTDEELRQAENLFPSDPIYKTKYGNVHPEKNLYIGGLFVKSLPPEEFKYGYDLPAKDIRINRDRAMVNEFDMFYQFGKIWSELWDTESAAVWKLVAAQSDEVKWLNSHIGGKRRKSLIERMMQSETMVVSSTERAKVARDLGYVPIINSYIGELSDEFLDRKKEEGKKDGEVVEISENLKHDVLRCERLVDLILDMDVKIIPYRFADKSQKGMYISNEGVDEIYVTVEKFSEMAATALHEAVHAATGADDFSRGMQAGLDRVIERLIAYAEVK